MKYIKRRELFDRQVRRLVMKLGGRPDPSQTRRLPWAHYLLDTNAGPLSLGVHTDLWAVVYPWARGGGCPWVSGRFDDVKAAVALLGQDEVNRFSGKWNHHCWNNWTDSFSGGLGLLEYDLRRLVAAPLPKAA